jgi:L,D-peptidoglycan transpeptidase YkuD (ErfK/YbiS/YcfS/YnhG family)
MKEFLMKKLIFVMLLSLLLTPTGFSQVTGAQKLIVMITEDWNSSKGIIFMFDKTKDGWKKQRDEFSVSLGEYGLAWGAGVHPVKAGDFVKTEGDMRSPAGIFELDSVLYGLDATGPEGVRYPYHRLTELTRCIDDTNSKAYNRIVEEDSLKKDWNSAEHMRKVDPDYKYVLVVRHNPLGEKGKGSCIFIHTNNVPTSGCTSMDEQDMLTLLHWLDPKRKTLVVQLPQPEYHRLRTEWGLPMLNTN